jgi:hypothetical protein
MLQRIREAGTDPADCRQAAIALLMGMLEPDQQAALREMPDR